jgi:UDP-N-acetylglucosamine 2-epimerase
MKVLSVVGARPQFIKASAVSRALRARHDEILVHTGQHYDDDMSALFFRELGVPEPDVHLGIGSGTHGEQTAGMICGLERAILDRHPDVVLVYGDTNSTLAGALAAAKLTVPVAHVEAGLRSFNRSMPEEINRVVADHLATWLFCPSARARENLIREGITTGVSVVGDVMADVLADTAGRVPAGVLARYGVAPGHYLLATMHRSGNTDRPERLRRLFDALGRLAEPVVFPLHPRTKAACAAQGIATPANVRAIDPLGYLEMIALERCARMILTDSGGVQKEAYWLGVPCVTLREETEWIETVDAGWNRLAGDDPDRIVDAVRTFAPPSNRPPLYGDGFASGRIAEILAT